MAALYLDRDINTGMIVPLRGRGHSVITVTERGKATGKDDEHLWDAAILNRVFVSHNLDHFTLLHRAWRRWSANWSIHQPHPGILILPQSPRMLVPEAVIELDAFLVAHPILTNEMHILRARVGWREIT